MPVVLPDPGFIVGPSVNPTQLVLDPTTSLPPDLNDDLPPFEQINPDIQAVLTAVGNELGRLEASRQDLIANWFPGTAGALLRFYEQMLGLPVEAPGISLADRQNQVLAFMRRLKSLGTGLEWENTMTALVGSQWSYQEHIPGDATTPPPYTIALKLPYSGAAPTPSGLAVVASSTAGSLPAGTFYYAVSAVTPFGQTLACAPVAFTATAGQAAALSWTTQPAPTISFNIFRGTSPTSLFYLGSSSGAAFTDNGTAALGNPAPSQDTSGSIHAASAIKLARSSTPAHVAIEGGTSSGFIVGVSDVGDVI